MPRALWLLLTIVAAFPADLTGATPISGDAPVTADIAAVARMVDIDPARDRARFMSEMTRLLYTPPPEKSAAVAALHRADGRANAPVSDFAVTRVPVPLSAEVWSGAVFRRTVKTEELVAAILADRRAALLCHALAALDDETLVFLSQHADILTELYEQDAPVFAAFGASLRVRAGRVAPPGGDAAIALWEGALGERVDNPDRFARALYGLYTGRLAYLYDTIAQLDVPKGAFALGLWMKDPAVRQARFNALVEVSLHSYREWRVDRLPFSRPAHDLVMMLMRMRVDPSGAPLPPAARAFWSEAFASDDLNDISIKWPAGGPSDDPIDAAWLAIATTGSNLYWRGDRLDQFAFGQRVFADAPTTSWADAIVAIRAFPRQRMLALALERSGIRSPATYAAAARRASRVADGSGNRIFWTMAQLQSALALVLRMIEVGTIDRPRGESLVASLSAVPADDDRYSGAIAQWFARALLPFLPVADSAESRVIAGLAGSAEATVARVSWEGEEYRLDLASAERRRLEIVREKQAGYSIDLALDLEAVATKLASPRLTAADLRAAAAALAGLAEAHGPRFTFAPDLRAPHIDEPRPVHAAVGEVVQDLSRIARGQDVGRAARVATLLREQVDVVLGDALLSLVYAAAIGDPEGPALLARNVALRHDFGFGRRDAEIRRRTAWAVPRRDFLPGVPWHVTGSALGLEIGLAPLALRRINLGRLADAPRLSSTEREAFAVGVVLLNARRLRDGDRDHIAAAIARGRQRVAALASGGESLDVVADVAGLDGGRRRAIAWMAANDAAGIPSMFSLVELAMLGGAEDMAAFDAWGASGLASLGCACTHLLTPRNWRLLAGRPQVGVMASGMADLNLRVAITLGELGLPAALARFVLAAAVLDFIEEVAPRDANDWWTVAHAAQTVPRERIEDYVAAAAAAVDGPLVPDEAVESDSEQTR